MMAIFSTVYRLVEGLHYHSRGKSTSSQNTHTCAVTSSF